MFSSLEAVRRILLGSPNLHTSTEVQSDSDPAETTQLVWYITGTSSGFGRDLVHILLERGDKVIATARSLDKIQDFPKIDRIRVQQLNVTDGAETIRKKIDEATAWFGRIDVLVNNAGVTVQSTIEEGGSEQFRREYDTNVFGQLDVTQAALAHMRPRRSGTIVMMGSRTSWDTVNPCTGLYASSKAAVRVLGEILAKELAQFSVRVLIVEPGAFRTNIMSSGLFFDGPLADYDETRKAAKKRIREISGTQPGDPEKAMRALVDVVRGEGFAKDRPWPLYLPLGAETEDAIRNKYNLLNRVMVEWDKLIRDTRLDSP